MDNITLINARNVNDALASSMWKLHTSGIREGSRNGPVLVMPGPVITTYERPRERVLFNANRDANPFFHLMEALWMLGGRNDVEFVAYFVKRMRQFSDDGETLHGAYGERWRGHFMRDQIKDVTALLRNDPTDRRAVIQMWDARVDLGRNGKDVPCNTQIYLRVHNNNEQAVPELDMTVTCRSNDAVWGAHGANAVHFSVLQEFIAHDLGIVVGTLYQVSNNYHVYLNQYNPDDLRGLYWDDSRYGLVGAVPYPLIKNSTVADWLIDLEIFLNEPEAHNEYHDEFFIDVAVPMFNSWQSHKRGAAVDAMAYANQIAAVDWHIACTEWLQRRAQ